MQTHWMKHPVHDTMKWIFEDHRRSVCLSDSATICFYFLAHPVDISVHHLLRLLLCLLQLTGQSISFGLDTLLSSLAGSPGLGPFGVHLLLENALTLFLGLGFVDL
jgi:hypothetical protein